MRHEILYSPAFACARVLLDPGQSIRCDGGAMVSMSTTITLESKMEGGIGKALGRMFSGETFFQSILTATHGAGEVLLAPSVFGDIIPIQLQGNGYLVTSGGYLASDTSLTAQTKGSWKAFGAGEGMFLTHLSAPAICLWLASERYMASSWGQVRRMWWIPAMSWLSMIKWTTTFDPSPKDSGNR
ncbi:MAG: AIM24 family protein [Fimbriimonadaceae bacterium]